MTQFFRNLAVAGAAVFILSTGNIVHAEFQGYIGAQARYFPNEAVDPEQHDEVVSAVIVPEWYQQLNNGNDSLNAKLFYRYDSVDEERSHFDIREMYWLHVGDQWELTVGVNKVFWGVTESQHLVDIINQTDQVEAPDGEEKLGQPMIHLALIRDWGVVDAFALPGFRPRTFAGSEGRFRSIPETVNKGETYDSADEEEHIDYAARWSNSIGDWDVGLSWFRGTSRDPMFFPIITPLATPSTLSPGAPGTYIVTLGTHYPLIEQFGIDAQYTSGDWLWKFEVIDRSPTRNSGLEDYIASTAGFEYTLVGIGGTIWDLGLLLEHSHDSRRTATAGPFQNDAFIGGRLALNDAASSDLLFGISQDLDEEENRSALLEASTRIGDATRATLEMAIFDIQSPGDPLYSLRSDSYIEFALEYYF
ncbi:MAG: hypothetical protein ACSHWQ_01130 [Spongiibacteraceae bacterium]